MERLRQRLIRKKAYCETEYLASQDDETPYCIYVIVRTFRLWMSPSGHLSADVKQSVISTSAKTKDKVELRIARLLAKKKLEPLPKEANNDEFVPEGFPIKVGLVIN